MRHGSKTAMYFRMLYRAAMLRKGQAASALTAIIVAAAAATAFLIRHRVDRLDLVRALKTRD